MVLNIPFFHIITNVFLTSLLSLVFSFEIKIIALCILIFLFFNNVRTIHKKYVFFLLFVVFSFAFIYSPYWYAFGTFGFPFLKYAAFIFLLIFGLSWAYFSADDLKLPKIRMHAIPIILLSLCLYIVNLRQLNADIPWRGDEDAHISILLRLKEYLAFFWKDANLANNPIFWIFILLIFLMFCLFLIYRRRILVNPLFVSSVLLLISLSALILFDDRVFTDQRNIFLLSDVLRYPFIQKWINLFFVIPNYYDISSYRIVPFLSYIGIAIFLYYIFYQQLRSKLMTFLFSFALSTIPLLLFYSSILYLEMPIVFLMLICIWNIKILVKDDAKKLKYHYVWYALLLLAFLKESVFIFLLLLLIIRMICQIFMKHKTEGVRKTLFSEVKISTLVISPVVMYLLFRNIFSPNLASSYGFYLNNIFSISNYAELIRSLNIQTAVMHIIGTIGLVFLSRKEVVMTRVIIMLFVGMAVFFLGYLHKDYSLLVGYSRWNLFLLPIILFGSAVFINHVGKRRRIYSVVLVSSMLVFNIALFPFKSDGVRLPNWGSSRLDTAEYTYPYDETIHFLSVQKKTRTILLLGQYSPYWGLRYYFEKYNFHPKVVEHYFGSTRFDEKKERQMIDLFFKDANFLADAILYHSVNNINLDMNALYGGKYKIARRVQNSLHSIYLFKSVGKL